MRRLETTKGCGRTPEVAMALDAYRARLLGRPSWDAAMKRLTA